MFIRRLGMNHDELIKDCPKFQFIMSQSTGDGRTMWSDCSIRQLATYIYEYKNKGSQLFHKLV